MPGIVKIAFLADVGAAKVGLTQFASDVDGTVSKVGKSWSGLKDKLKLGALAGAAALGAGLAEGLDFGAAQSKLKAQLGLTGADAEKVGKAAGDLYKSGFGDSVESAGDTIKAAFQNGIVGIQSTREEIAGVGADIENYIVLSGEDAQATTRAVAQILKNKLAPNAKAAFDLLVKGQQLGINKSEDLLDTFNEYSTEFRQLGIDGPKALGLMNQGLKAGARDADTVADALKEFAIRAKDGSKTTVDGFKLIGLNADRMQKTFAAGGPGAAAGLDLVLDRIRAIKDPALQSQAAVDLFGTKSEDLQAALLALDPSTAVKGLGDLAGAAERAGDTLNDNAKARLTSFVRTVKTDVVEFLGTKVIPKLEEWGTAFEKKVKPKIDALVDDALPAAKTAIKDVTDFVDENKQTFIDLATNTATLATNISTKLTPAVRDLGPALKAVAEADLTDTVAALQGINVLLSGKTASGDTAGLGLKLQSLGRIAQQFNLGTKFGDAAAGAIFSFGQKFINDVTMQKSVSGWISKNLGNIVSFLPFGALQSAGLLAADKVGRAFGAKDPTASVVGFMTKLGATVLKYNPVSLALSAGRLMGAGIDKGLLGSQPTVLGRAKALIRNLGTALVSSLPVGPIIAYFQLKGVDVMHGLERGILGGVKIVVRAISGIPGDLAASGGNWGSALFHAGSEIISGLIAGIRSKIPDVHSVLSGVTNIIPSWKGPLDKDKVLLTPAGVAIMSGLIGGIESQLPELKRSLTGVSGSIEAGLSAKPTVQLSAAAALGSRTSSLGASTAPVINVYALTASPEVGRQVISAIAEYEAFNGTSWRNTGAA